MGEEVYGYFTTSTTAASSLQRCLELGVLELEVGPPAASAPSEGHMVRLLLSARTVAAALDAAHDDAPAPRLRPQDKHLREVVKTWRPDLAASGDQPEGDVQRGGGAFNLDPEELYEALRPSGREPELQGDPPGLVPALRPYQRRAAAWMVGAHIRRP
eukprot:8634667-Pyramimonas_sp.AAC.2